MDSVTRKVNWFTMDDYPDSIGILDTEVKQGNWDDADDFTYICPKCGKPSTYWEGTFDQDRMGNDIRGWSFDCFNCKITTGAEEF